MNRFLLENLHKDLFSKFLDEWIVWNECGREPENASLEMRYWLDLQELRLKSHHLSCRMHVEKDGSIFPVCKVSCGIPLKERVDLYRQETYFQKVCRHLEYVRFGEVVYKFTDYVSFYEVIIDRPDSHDVPFVCPNCGGQSVLSVVERSGCPFCGTHYVMSDLFPKVTNFFCVENGDLADSMYEISVRKILFWAFVASILVDVFFVVNNGFSLFFFVWIGFIGFGIFFVLFFAEYIIYLYVRMFKVAGKDIGLMKACAGSKKRISTEISKYDPTFNYEYFESKALSLARLEIFSEEMFDSIIDVKYRGGFRLNKHSVSNGIIRLDLDLFVVLTEDVDNRVFEKEGIIHLSMCHDTQFPTDDCFNISKVVCEHCGGSFDAHIHSKCPYCDRPYNVENKDWKVLSLSISK